MANQDRGLPKAGHQNAYKRKYTLTSSNGTKTYAEAIASPPTSKWQAFIYSCFREFSGH